MAVKLNSKAARDAYIASLKAAPTVVHPGPPRPVCPTCGKP